jgi:hypothetical protein
LKFIAFFITAFFIGITFSQTNLPVCQGSDTLQWNNCVGTLDFGGGLTFRGSFRNGKPIDTSSVRTPVGDLTRIFQFENNDALQIDPTTSFSGAVIAFNFSKLSTNGKYVEIPIVIDFAQPKLLSKYYGVTSAQAQVLVDCTSRSFLFKNWELYFEHMAQGAKMIVPQDQFKSGFIYEAEITKENPPQSFINGINKSINSICNRR